MAYWIAQGGHVRSRNFRIPIPTWLRDVTVWTGYLAVVAWILWLGLTF